MPPNEKEINMSTQENKALVRRIFEEGINQNQPSVFDDLIAPSYVNYDFPAPTQGPEGFKMVIGMFRAAFPDMRVNLEEELAEDDKVIRAVTSRALTKVIFKVFRP